METPRRLQRICGFGASQMVLEYTELSNECGGRKSLILAARNSPVRKPGNNIRWLSKSFTLKSRKLAATEKMQRESLRQPTLVGSWPTQTAVFFLISSIKGAPSFRALCERVGGLVPQVRAHHITSRFSLNSTACANLCRLTVLALKNIVVRIFWQVRLRSVA